MCSEALPNHVLLRIRAAGARWYWNRASDVQCLTHGPRRQVPGVGEDVPRGGQTQRGARVVNSNVACISCASFLYGAIQQDCMVYNMVHTAASSMCRRWRRSWRLSVTGGRRWRWRWNWSRRTYTRSRMSSSCCASCSKMSRPSTLTSTPNYRCVCVCRCVCVHVDCQAVDCESSEVYVSW